MLSSSSGAPARESLYGSVIDEEHADLFNRTTADTDMSDEIRLMRFVMALLARDKLTDTAAIVRAMAVLYRLVEVTAKLDGGRSPLELALLEASERVLRRAEQEKQQEDAQEEEDVDELE